MKRSLLFKHAMTFGLCLSLSFNPLIPGIFAQTVPTRIDLVVVEGEGVIHNLRQRAARIPVVRVEDENHQPVEGAAVVFTLPVSGTSGEFGNNSKTLIVTTGKDGLAAAQGLKINQVEGKLQIYVTASYRGQRARTLINQFNMDAPGAAPLPAPAHKSGSNTKVWIILAAVGAAAAAGGALAATHKGSGAAGVNPSPSAPVAISITPGAGSIGPPH
jgi:hypothetical protein